MDAKSKAIGALAFAILTPDQQLAAYATLKVVNDKYGADLTPEHHADLQGNIQLAEVLLGIDSEEKQ